jgi:hypothetical protein
MGIYNYVFPNSGDQIINDVVYSGGPFKLENNKSK